MSFVLATNSRFFNVSPVFSSVKTCVGICRRMTCDLVSCRHDAMLQDCRCFVVDTSVCRHCAGRSSAAPETAHLQLLTSSTCSFHHTIFVQASSNPLRAPLTVTIRTLGENCARGGVKKPKIRTFALQGRNYKSAHVTCLLPSRDLLDCKQDVSCESFKTFIIKVTCTCAVLKFGVSVNRTRACL
jgi:hypothetical protein